MFYTLNPAILKLLYLKFIIFMILECILLSKILDLSVYATPNYAPTPSRILQHRPHLQSIAHGSPPVSTVTPLPPSLSVPKAKPVASNSISTSSLS